MRRGGRGRRGPAALTPASADGPERPRGPPVFVYWDYACPFSYLLHRRLDALSRERPVALVWRPLELTRLPAGSAAEGGPPAGGTGAWAASASASWDHAREELHRLAADEGVPLTLPPRAPDTHDALQAAEFARDVGRQVFERLHGALFRAVFVHGEDVGDRGRLLALAEREGVDRQALEAALSDGRYEEELDAALGEAARYDIGGTPTALFGRFKVVGAAPLERLREAHDRAREEEEG